MNNQTDNPGDPNSQTQLPGSGPASQSEQVGSLSSGPSFPAETPVAPGMGVSSGPSLSSDRIGVSQNPAGPTINPPPPPINHYPSGAGPVAAAPPQYSPPPTVVSPPPAPVTYQAPAMPTIISPMPPPTQTVIQAGPAETASEIQQRIVQDEQVKEVKRVRRGYKLENAVNVLFGMIEGALALRLIFKLLGAKDNNPFIALLYQFTGIFATPFDGIFGGNPSFGRFVLDIGSVIGMVVYALIGFGLLRLVKVL
ncbi:MAG: YggT family protein [Candidatus Pacebacteria bacterium]|nr:YggT family protein [Candidatus Paceibacterota bacterium]